MKAAPLTNGSGARFGLSRRVCRADSHGCLGWRLRCQDPFYVIPELVWSGRGFDFAWSPSLVEEGLERAVKPQDDEPAFVGVGLDPVAGSDVGGLGGREVHDGGAVGFGLGGG